MEKTTKRKCKRSSICEKTYFNYNLGPESEISTVKKGTYLTELFKSRYINLLSSVSLLSYYNCFQSLVHLLLVINTLFTILSHLVLLMISYH